MNIDPFFVVVILLLTILKVIYIPVCVVKEIYRAKKTLGKLTK